MKLSIIRHRKLRHVLPKAILLLALFLSMLMVLMSSTSTGFFRPSVDRAKSTQRQKNVRHSELVSFAFEKYSNACSVARLQDLKAKRPSTDFKIFLYELPKELNVKLSECIFHMRTDACFRSDHCGFGPTFSDTEMSVRGTWQFNLEVIIHHKLLYSPYRTLNPEDADIFYIPYYAAHACYCHPLRYKANPRKTIPEMIENLDLLQNFLKNSEYFGRNKQHLMAIGKIEREHSTASCPLLRWLNFSNVRVIGIEENGNQESRQMFSNYHKPLVVAPYPSYAHFSSIDQERVSSEKDRTVFILLAAGGRRSNRFRARLFDKISTESGFFKTSGSYHDMVKLEESRETSGRKPTKDLDIVWLTTSECRGQHHLYTIDWMQRSVFCLEPAGDSPTRKSFYDAIAGGCIPVVFEEPSKTRRPFEDKINYDQFTVKIPKEVVLNPNISVVNYLRSRVTKDQIAEMQQAMTTVGKYLQYSYPIVQDTMHDDAMKYILEEVGSLLSRW